MPSHDIFHRLHNLIRLGTIAAVDHAQAQCRVKTGELLTDWLHWVTLAAGAVRNWQPPTLGEQVLLLCPGGELSAGVALCGIYSETYPAPSHEANNTLTRYDDGAVIAYDAARHHLNISLPNGGTVALTAPHSVTITSPSLTLNTETVTCTGDLIVQGHLSYAGGLSGTGGEGAQIEGSIQASGDIQAGGISLSRHRHSGVESGGSLSGGPQ